MPTRAAGSIRACKPAPTGSRDRPKASNHAGFGRPCKDRASTPQANTDSAFETRDVKRCPCPCYILLRKDPFDLALVQSSRPLLLRGRSLALAVACARLRLVIGWGVAPGSRRGAPARVAYAQVHGAFACGRLSQGDCGAVEPRQAPIRARGSFVPAAATSAAGGLPRGSACSGGVAAVASAARRVSPRAASSRRRSRSASAAAPAPGPARRAPALRRAHRLLAGSQRARRGMAFGRRATRCGGLSRARPPRRPAGALRS